VLGLSVETGGEQVELGALLDRTGTTSFLVLRDRCVIAEHYGDGTGPEELQTSFSMAKSFLSTLVGIAIDRGDLTGLDEPITTYLPELAERDDRYSRITLRHLVTMSSGLHYEERGLPWSDDALTYYSPDLRDTALSADIEEPPGREWLYNNYNPLLMGLVLERATGMHVAEYMERYLWQPMGANHDASWSLDSTSSGFEKMESGVNAVARDYARFGYLFAHRGRAAGRQVVPAEWVAEATAVDTSTHPNRGYQYWWWVDDARPHRFFAKGNLGQFIYVDDRSDLVVVRTGTGFGIEDWPLVLRQVTDQVTDQVTGEREATARRRAAPSEAAVPPGHH
jgi:CubicO group peptidase (beta-lactamase class C family)